MFLLMIVACFVVLRVRSECYFFIEPNYCIISQDFRIFIEAKRTTLGSIQVLSECCDVSFAKFKLDA